MKLTYFNCRGLAETSRLLLAFVEADYTDFRYPLKAIDLSIYKFEKDEFDADKASGKLSRSLNKVPYLEVDGQVICQSKTIERFLAQKYNLMGTTPIESARIDSICESVRDIKEAYKQHKRDDKLTEWFETVLPERLVLLENLFDPEPSDYLIGNQTSLADIVVYSLITHFFDNTEGAYKATKGATRVRRSVDVLAETPQIKKWIAERPPTDF